MAKVLHIQDAYFKIPEKAKDDFACAITMLGIYLQRNNLTLDDMNKIYDTEILSEFFEDNKQTCLLSCIIEE